MNGCPKLGQVIFMGDSELTAIKHSISFDDKSLQFVSKLSVPLEVSVTLRCVMPSTEYKV